MQVQEKQVLNGRISASFSIFFAKKNLVKFEKEHACYTKNAMVTLAG
jgi:hypothetical protein